MGNIKQKEADKPLLQLNCMQLCLYAWLLEATEQKCMGK